MITKTFFNNTHILLLKAKYQIQNQRSYFSHSSCFYKCIKLLYQAH